MVDTYHMHVDADGCHYCSAWTAILVVLTVSCIFRSREKVHKQKSRRGERKDEKLAADDKLHLLSSALRTRNRDETLRQRPAADKKSTHSMLRFLLWPC